MANDVEQLLGDSLFQVNLLLWMLQKPQVGEVRPLLAEAGYALKAVEQELPIPPALIAQLNKAGVTAKEYASPDVLVTADQTEHFIIECKAQMFGAEPGEGGKDDHQRQAKAFLLQSPKVLSSALAGAKVTKVDLGYLTKHDAKHDQSAGIRTLSGILKSAKMPVIPSCVFRLAVSNEGICLLFPSKGEKWPTRISNACGKATGKKSVTIIPADKDGNDLRPLYFVPWMPDSESQPSDYNRTAFGNRILGTAVIRVGKSPIDQDVVLDYEDLLNEATLGIFKRWRNTDTKKNLRKCVRKLICDQLKKTSAITSEDNAGRSVTVKLCEEKIRAAVIRVLREKIDTKWNQPDPQPDLFEDLMPSSDGAENSSQGEKAIGPSTDDLKGGPNAP